MGGPQHPPQDVKPSWRSPMPGMITTGHGACPPAGDGGSGSTSVATHGSTIRERTSTNSTSTTPASPSPAADRTERTRRDPSNNPDGPMGAHIVRVSDPGVPAVARPFATTRSPHPTAPSAPDSVEYRASHRVTRDLGPDRGRGRHCAQSGLRSRVRSAQSGELGAHHTTTGRGRGEDRRRHRPFGRSCSRARGGGRPMERSPPRHGLLRTW